MLRRRVIARIKQSLIARKSETLRLNMAAGMPQVFATGPRCDVTGPSRHASIVESALSSPCEKSLRKLAFSL